MYPTFKPKSEEDNVTDTLHSLHREVTDLPASPGTPTAGRRKSWPVRSVAILAIFCIGALVLMVVWPRSPSRLPTPVPFDAPVAELSPAEGYVVPAQRADDSAADIVSAFTARAQSYIRSGDASWLPYLYATPRQTVLTEFVATHASDRFANYETRDIASISRTPDSIVVEYVQLVDGKPVQSGLSKFSFTGLYWVAA